MATALYEFMPYGAPELIEGAPRRMFRATTSGIVLCILIFLVALGWTLTRSAVTTSQRTVVIPFRELAAPPPLTEMAPPPQIAVATAAVTPSMGVPVPVPDAQAPQEQTIASQQEISDMTGSVNAEAGTQSLVVESPPAEELPKMGDFVYTDEMPALITDTPPVYPMIAREAGVEGEVALRVLVGKDGRVLEVHVDKSVPMLDQAAIDAARTWVFKPALCQNRPVAVWISRRLHFSLTAHRS